MHPEFDLIRVLSIIGIPSICAAGIIALWKIFYTFTKNQEKKNDAIQLGLQAVLRDRLYQLYAHCKTVKGYAGINDRNNFENMFKNYEALGENGVMRNIHDKFMSLPTSPERSKKATYEELDEEILIGDDIYGT